MAETLSLSKPITAHGNEVTALTLRLPTGKDISACGVPYKLAADGEMSINAPAMHRMIAQLAAVPPSSVDQMAAGDWNRAAMLVLGFITAEAETQPATKPN